MSANTNSSNATGVFMDHIKQVLYTLPPVTKFALAVPTLLFLVDTIASSFFSLSYWTYLDTHLVIDRWQSTIQIYTSISNLTANFH